MPPNLALVLSIAFIAYAYWSDRKRSTESTKGLLAPSLWYLIVTVRPTAFWLGLAGIQLSGGGADPTEGNAIDRYIFTVLTLYGLYILSRRRFDWPGTLRRNRWLVCLLVLMAVSIFWSDYSFVSFKRFIKVVGSIVMALVILSSADPLFSFSTVLRRCLYIHIPMSILCTRYFRDIGLTWDWNGTTAAWTGIATSKNVLGQVAMLGTVYFLWQVRLRWRKIGWKNIHCAYLLMSVYLLKGAGSISMTSISLCIFALTIFLCLQSYRARPRAARPFVRGVFAVTVCTILLVVVHSVVMFSADSIFGHIITILGRDITLTQRTDIWHDVYGVAAHNPIFGVGFGGFWIGRLANIPWNAHMTWVLGQAHSGYVDTYLQLGFVGTIFLTIALFTTLPHLLRSLDYTFDFACLRICLFLTIVFINMTESVYLRGDHHLWLILMVTMWNVPPKIRRQVAPRGGKNDEEAAPRMSAQMPAYQ